MDALIRRSGQDWLEPTHGYTNEAELQELLAEHPNLVTGEDGVACREFQSGVGPADIVIITQDGSITLVECKLAANPQIRREIIGQLFDYAARLWKMPVDEFIHQWESQSGTTPFDVLDDSDGQLRETLAHNLADGRFRLVIAVDQINDQLRRIVEYLNMATPPGTGVIAMEFRRIVEADVEVLLPQTYGSELVNTKERNPRRDRAVTNPARRALITEVAEAIQVQHPDLTLRKHFNESGNFYNLIRRDFGWWRIWQPTGELRIDVYLQPTSRASLSTKEIFDAAYERAAELDRASGAPLLWERLDGNVSSRIAACYRSEDLYTDAGRALAVAWAANAFTSMFAGLDKVLCEIAQGKA